MTDLVDAQRLANFKAGARLLQDWLQDQVRFGLATIEADPRGHFEQIAAQLTDAQLPGPAESLRALSQRVAEGGNWIEVVLDTLGYWHLQTSLMLQPERLTPQQLDGVLLALGLRVRKATLQGQETSPAQRWSCIGLTLTERSNVFARCVYWLGETTSAWAEQLDFNYGGPPTPIATQIGDAGTFGVHAYPGGLPGRALLPERRSLSNSTHAPPAHASIAQQQAYAERLLIEQPWRRRIPFLLAVARLKIEGDRLLLVDNTGEALAVPATDSDTAAWQLLAVSGGDSCHVYGVMTSGSLELLSVYCEGRLSGLG